LTGINSYKISGDYPISGRKIKAKPIKIVWRKDYGDLYATPIYFKDLIYAPFFKHENSSKTSYEFISMNASQGEILWRLNLDSPEFVDSKEGTGGVTKAIVTDEKVFFGMRNGIICCIEQKTGKLVWKYNSGKGIDAPISLYRNTIYFGSDDCHFFALSADDGSLIWKSKLFIEQDKTNPEWIISKPLFWNERVLFTTWDSSLYCLNAKDGKLLWKISELGAMGTYFSHENRYPVVHEDVIYIPHEIGWLIGINLNHKGIVWIVKDDRHRSIREVSKSTHTPLIYKDVLYYGSEGKYVEAYPVKLKSFFPAELFTLNIEDRIIFEPIEDKGWINFLCNSYIYSIEGIDLYNKNPFLIKKFSLPGVPQIDYETIPIAVNAGKVWLGLRDGTFLCGEFI
jgi:outer membrane protein assembly factor BamB